MVGYQLKAQPEKLPLIVDSSESPLDREDKALVMQGFDMDQLDTKAITKTLQECLDKQLKAVQLGPR